MHPLTWYSPMMIRLLSASAGLLSASATAAIEVANASPPTMTVAWSAIAGIAGAGATYGVLTSKVNAAHAKIEVEKADRIQSVANLKDDVNRGFDRIERQLTAQTETVIAALKDKAL